MDRETTVRCARCMKVCTGETLRFNDQLFHANCLVCLVCGKDLADAGFFVQNNQYFCPEDFQERFGTKCFVCHQFLEGEGINIGGNAYHERCFVCAACRNPFPPGEKVVLKGSEYICQQCSARETSSDARGHKLEKCAGCGEDIRSGQSLLALEKQWHLWCFTCSKCGCLLAGEYMGRDGKPYCEKDYQAEFGVMCAGCGGYIIGKVLQAGEKHYHPQCSRCARCHGVFGEGQEMFLQGSEIWHPDCSFAAQQNGELDMHSAAPRDGYQNTADEEALRPSPPTRTSASRTTDWKVKYSPQKEEETYRQEPWRGGQDEQPAYQPRYTSHTDSRPYNSTSFAEITARRETSLNEVPREKGSMAPLDMQEFEREVDKKPSTYAYKDIITTNYKLPRGVDKTKLETYLTDEEFFEVFKMTREEFYHLPNWKQGSKKKEVLLF